MQSWCNLHYSCKSMINHYPFFKLLWLMQIAAKYNSTTIGVYLTGNTPTVYVNGKNSSLVYSDSAVNISTPFSWEVLIQFSVPRVALSLKYYRECFDFNIKVASNERSTRGICGSFNQPLAFNNNPNAILSTIASTLDFHLYGESCMYS